MHCEASKDANSNLIENLSLLWSGTFISSGFYISSDFSCQITRCGLKKKWKDRMNDGSKTCKNHSAPLDYLDIATAIKKTKSSQ